MTKIYAARYSLNGNENLRSFSVNDVQEIYEHYNRLNEECGYDTASGEGKNAVIKKALAVTLEPPPTGISARIETPLRSAQTIKAVCP